MAKETKLPAGAVRRSDAKKVLEQETNSTDSKDKAETPREPTRLPQSPGRFLGG